MDDINTKPIVAENKKCRKCGFEGPPIMFYKDANPYITASGERKIYSYYKTCKECHNLWCREKGYFRGKDRKDKQKVNQEKYRKNNQNKVNARNEISCLIAKGIVVPLPCIKCGSVNSEAHHPDYSQPLTVVWLCKKHHSELHTLIKLSSQ